MPEAKPLTAAERADLRKIFWSERGSLMRLQQELGVSRTQLNGWFRFGRLPAVDRFEELVRKRAAEIVRRKGDA